MRFRHLPHGNALSVGTCPGAAIRIRVFLLFLPSLFFYQLVAPAGASRLLLRSQGTAAATHTTADSTRAGVADAGTHAGTHTAAPPPPPFPFDYVKEPYTREQSSDLTFDERVRDTPSLPLPATWKAPTGGVCGPLIQKHCKQEIQAANGDMLENKDAYVKRAFQNAVFPLDAECGRMFCNPFCLKGAVKCTVSVAGAKSRIGEQISQTQYMGAICAQVIAAVCTGSSSGGSGTGCCTKDPMIARWVEDHMYSSGVRRGEDEFDEATMSRDTFDPTNRGYSGTWRRVKKGALHVPDVIPLEKEEGKEDDEKKKNEKKDTPPPTPPPEGGRYERQPTDAMAALGAAGIVGEDGAPTGYGLGAARQANSLVTGTLQTLNDPAATVPLLPLPACRYSGARGGKALFEEREARCKACMKEVGIKLEPDPVFCASLEAPLPNGLPRPFKKGNGEDRLQVKRFKNTELTDEPEKDWGGGGYGGVTRFDLGKMTSMWAGLGDMNKELAGHSSLYERCVAFVGALRTTGWLKDWEMALGKKKREVCGCLGCCDPKEGADPKEGQCFFPFFQQAV